MSGPIFVETVFTVNGEEKTLNALSKGNSYMLDFNCVGYKSLKSVDEICLSGKKYSLSRNFLNLNDKKESSSSNKGKISFEEKTFSLNGAKVPINCVLTSKGDCMCDTYSDNFGLLQSAKTIEADGKSYILKGKYLNVTEFKRIEVSALFDRADGFQGSVRLTIQGKNPSTGGLVVNQEIFQGKTFTSKGFVCLIEGIVWRIVSNPKGIWAHPVPNTELFKALRSPRNNAKDSGDDLKASDDDADDGSGDWT
jgi:hypothetical protein